MAPSNQVFEGKPSGFFFPHKSAKMAARDPISHQSRINVGIYVGLMATIIKVPSQPWLAVAVGTTITKTALHVLRHPVDINGAV